MPQLTKKLINEPILAINKQFKDDKSSEPTLISPITKVSNNEPKRSLRNSKCLNYDTNNMDSIYDLIFEDDISNAALQSKRTKKEFKKESFPHGKPYDINFISFFQMLKICMEILKQQR